MNISRTAILRTGTLSAVAGLALLGLSNAQAAAPIVQDFTIPIQTTDFTKMFTFNQFDTLGGTRSLDSVELSINATGKFGGSVTNNAASTETFVAAETSAVTFTGPDNTSVVSNLGASQTYTNLAAGATAPFGPFLATPGAATTFVPTADFGLFTGTGLLSPLSIVSTVSGQSVTGGGGNIVAAFTTQVGATAELVYTYHTNDRNPTPEPGAWASMSIGVLGLMALGLRARKKNLQF
jgi:cytoskeletal protein RodZ